MWVLSPDCPPRTTVESATLSSRLETMADKVIGFLDNRRAFRYFAHMKERIESEYRPKEIVYLAKAATTGPAPLEKIKELADRCDAVIVGVAM